MHPLTKISLILPFEFKIGRFKLAASPQAVLPVFTSDGITGWETLKKAPGPGNACRNSDIYREPLS